MILRFILTYIIFGIFCFCFIYFFSTAQATSFFVEKEADALYAEATSLSASYASDYYANNMTREDLQTRLTVLSSYMEARVRMLSAKGEIITDTEGASSTSGLNELLVDFDPTLLSNAKYDVGTFFDSLPEECLNVIYPVTVDYQIRGYISIHKPLSLILSETDQFVNVIYISFIGIYVLVFVCWACLFLLYYLPLRRMIRAAERYAYGDFTASIDTKHHDELDYFGDALNYMARELRTLEEDERKFISNISHDFRSPLTSIKGYVEAMKDGTIPIEMQEKYFDIILFETERLTKLTTNMLDINKYGQGGLIMDISDFDINSVIKNTAATFEGACVKKHIMIDLVLTGETMLVTADMSKIQQVLYNLIDNAIKFSNENSSIKIETTDRGEKIFISVKDTGIGIPKNSINKVFERFYKTDLSRGKDKKGTGLGLAIVKEIIQAHKENINVISTEGVGTEFIFSLTKARE